MGGTRVHDRQEAVRARRLTGLKLWRGEWVDAGDDLVEVRSPVDGSLVGKVPQLSAGEIDERLQLAAAGQRRWAQVPVHERAEILHAAADRLEQRVDEIAGLLQAEIGKSRKESREEVLRSADLIRYTAEEGRRIVEPALLGESFPRTRRGKVAMSFRAPLGVVLAIPPFNYPVNLAVAKIAPALIAGNAVALKPPTQGTVASHFLAAAFFDGGLPPDVLHLITGKGEAIGDYLVTHPGVHMISFTGSSETGRRIAERAGMIPLNLELGGKDAAIVLGDADLDLAVKEIVSGAFAYSGQRCTAIKRVLATEPIADALVGRLVPAVEALKVGRPEEDAVITPLISDRAASYVEELIEDAVVKGAQLLCGGRCRENLVWPTVLDHVDERMRIAWEEPFGPVLPVLRVPNAAEAVRIANLSEYGLQSSIFSLNIDVAVKIALALEVGTVQINGKTARGPDHFPFLGTKRSGLGAQGVRHAIESMTRVKSVVLNLQDDIPLEHLA